jgi:hypothetical protein
MAMEVFRQLIPRRNRRVSVSLRANLICGGQTIPVHLLDLSKEGALAHAHLPPNSNAIVWLRSNGLETPARIVWTRGDRFGLSFSRVLSDAQFEGLVRPSLTVVPA